MAGSTSKSNAPKARKRVEVETSTLKRARDGSAFARCEECKKDVPVVLIDMHNCSFESKIKMNLEAQVIERVAEGIKPAEKKTKAASSEPKAKKSKPGKKVKDPNAPKRPPTAFFLFMNDFRKSYKEENPDGGKDVKLVAIEGGKKWKSMTSEEKKLYMDRAQEIKEATYKEKEEQKEQKEQEEQEDQCSEKEE